MGSVSQVDVRTYVPASGAATGYVSFLRSINTGTVSTPVYVARVDGSTGLVGSFGVLSSGLPAGAAVTFSAQQVESALGTSLLASDRPRMRLVGALSSVEAQSFMLQPGGLFDEVSGAQTGATVTVRTYIPAADAPTGYTSYIRVINPSTTVTTVAVALIDGATGAAGTSRTLIASMPAQAAQTFSSAQIEALIGAVPAGSRSRLRISSPTPLEVQSFLTQPGGAFTNISSGVVASAPQVDVRTYVPAASAATGYVSYLRVINTGTLTTPVSVARIDGNTGVVGTASTGNLTPLLSPDAAVTFTAQQVEVALGGSPLSASDRPRLRVFGNGTALEVQSFLLQPGGLFDEVSAAELGSTILVRSYIPAADAPTGYTSYIRVINPGTTATPVSIALVNGDTGIMGATATLFSTLPGGAAQTLSSTQIESLIGTVPAGTRPRLRISGNVPLEVQSFITQPGGAFTIISNGQ